MLKQNEKEIKTFIIRKKMDTCGNIEELSKEVHIMLRSRPEQWRMKINRIIQDNGYTKSTFAKLCGVSRVTIDKWCKGAIPKNRETFLRIGLVANYDQVNMNQFLQRYGRYSALYVKSLEDCICIFVLNHYKPEERIEKYYFILNKIKENIIRQDSDDAQNEGTEKFEEKLSNVQSEEELDRFIEENIKVFGTAYHRLNSYIKVYVENETFLKRYHSDSVSNMENRLGWSSSLKQCMSAIRQMKWYPTRNKIISLGMHLSMDHDEIDELLTLAHMEPLCTKNIAENVIIFILEDASLNEMFEKDSEGFAPEDLCVYARKILKDPVLAEMKVEVEDFISELSETDEE